MPVNIKVKLVGLEQQDKEIELGRISEDAPLSAVQKLVHQHLPADFSKSCHFWFSGHWQPFSRKLVRDLARGINSDAANMEGIELEYRLDRYYLALPGKAAEPKAINPEKQIQEWLQGVLGDSCMDCFEVAVKGGSTLGLARSLSEQKQLPQIGEQEQRRHQLVVRRHQDVRNGARVLLFGLAMAGLLLGWLCKTLVG